MTDIISQIETAETQSAVADLVERALAAVGITDANSETYAETAERIRARNPDLADLLDAAEARWFEVE